MSNNSDDKIKSTENQQKDSQGCLDITTNHQKHDDDDDTKKIVILHQDPKRCQDVTMETIFLHKNPKGCEDNTMGIKKVVLQQVSKGCQDITKDHEKDDDTKKTMLLHKNPILGYEDITMGIKKVVVLQQESKGCQDITINHRIDDDDDDTNKLETLQQVIPKGCQGDDHIAHCQEDGVINETKVAQPDDDDDGFKTPTSLESKIPILTTCPPAPKPKKRGIKRKAWQRTVRV